VPTAFPHSFARDPDLPKSARSSDQVSAFRVSRNQCHDVRTLLIAKEFVGNGKVSRCLDNRLHKFLCTPVDTKSQDKPGAIGHQLSRSLSRDRQFRAVTHRKRGVQIAA